MNRFSKLNQAEFESGVLEGRSIFIAICQDIFSNDADKAEAAMLKAKTIATRISNGELNDRELGTATEFSQWLSVRGATAKDKLAQNFIAVRKPDTESDWYLCDKFGPVDGPYSDSIVTFGYKHE
jgi:hypothetical protein